MIDSNF